MNKFVNILKSLALVSFCILCTAVTIFVIHIDRSMNNVNQVFTDVDATVKRADLLVKQLEYLVLNAGETANQLRKASIQETATLNKTNEQLQITLSNVNRFVVSAESNQVEIASTTNTTIKQVQPVLLQTQETVKSLQGTIEDVDKIVTNPAIPAALNSTQKASEATADSMVQVDAMAVEGRQWFHSMLHPSWPKRVYHVVLDVARVLNPL